MAKKTNESSNNFVRGCAYIALIIAMFTFLFGGIVRSLEIEILTRFISLANLIGKICLVIGVALPAYDFTRGKAKFWGVLFWIALIVSLVACLL